jgi:hypothetical protein
MITYKWSIRLLGSKPASLGEKYFVDLLSWSLNATDSQGNYAACFGTTQLNRSEEEYTYTPIENLTEEQVVGWLLDTLGEEQVVALKASLELQLEQNINFKNEYDAIRRIMLVPPWDNDTLIRV